MTSPRGYISKEELSKRYRPSYYRITDYDVYQASRVYVEVLRGCSNYHRTRVTLKDGQRCIECGHCDDPDPMVRMDCPESIPPGCGFCSVPNTWGPPRSIAADAIIEEVHVLLDLGVHRIVLEAPDFLDYMRGTPPVTDPCSPSANLEAIEDLLSGIINLPQFQDETASLSIENVKACLFTDEVASLLSNIVGGISPNIGLETGSPEHAQLIGKCGNPNDVVQAVQIAKKYEMSPYVYLIYGLPGETADTVKASVKLMEKVDELGAERIILYGFRSLPGSAFEGFPEPEHDTPLGQILRDTAERINREHKTKYVGRKIRGITAEASWHAHGFTMVYPFTEGPLMTARGGYTPGTPVTVLITGVLSAGLLEGEIQPHESE